MNLNTKTHNPKKMNEQRLNVQTKLREFVGDGCAELEQGIYDAVVDGCRGRTSVEDWSPLFIELYLKKLQTIMYNLSAHEPLRTHTPLKDVATMTHQEMNPEQWEVYALKKEKRDQHRTTQTIKASTDLYTCFKCKKSECIYNEVQTKSADESMTVFVTCVNCENRWRC